MPDTQLAAQVYEKIPMHHGITIVLTPSPHRAMRNTAMGNQAMKSDRNT